MISASLGEIAACSIRVPSEVIKQRAQSQAHHTSLSAFKSIIANETGEGVFRGLYRGWSTTIMREIPFTVIQFPLYEKFKVIRASQQGGELSWADGAICGSVAGGIAAALTTPLDVLKTRLMLSPHPVPVLTIAKQIITEEGYSAFWKGVGPRTMWISAGGAIFLGVYEIVKKNTLHFLNPEKDTTVLKS